MKKTLNFALIGGGFIGKAHSFGLKNVGMFFSPPLEPVMHTLCDINPTVEDMTRRFGWMNAETDWKKVVANPEIDAVVVATPGWTHKEIVCAAAEAGRHILCEKPMSVSYEDACIMEKAISGKTITAMMGFNYRFVPAIRAIRQMIVENRLGRIYGFDGRYVQQWAIEESFPHVWRMDVKNVGIGPLEVGSHIVDLARYLVGEFQEVGGMLETFIKTRRDQNGIEKTVTTDDYAVFSARFVDGALGVFQAGRVNCGHKNELSFTINGSKGSVRFNLERINELEICLKDEGGSDWNGYKTVSITENNHPFMSHWWATGHVIGWENLFVQMYSEFIDAISGKNVDIPRFSDGVQSHRIIQAVVDSSAAHKYSIL